MRGTLECREVQDKPAESTRPAAGRATLARRTSPPDQLASLKKMSTTAGMGSQEYVAVNPLAVAALLLGVASLLVFVHDVLLLIPLAGVVCAIIAWRQIRNSNGTQTGRLMALAGLVLCAGHRRLQARLEGHRRVVEPRRQGRDRRLVSQLGEHLSHEEYQAAYGLFTPRFQQRVSQQRFTARLQGHAAPTRARRRLGDGVERARRVRGRPPSPTPASPTRWPSSASRKPPSRAAQTVEPPEGGRHGG